MSVIFAVIASPFPVKVEVAPAIALDQLDQEEKQNPDDNEDKQYSDAYHCDLQYSGSAEC
jgi:hypothetical protein